MGSIINLSLPEQYKRLAKDSLSNRETKKASTLYFKAAEAALEVYKETPNLEEQDYWQDFIYDCVKKGRRYTPTSKNKTKKERGKSDGNSKDIKKSTLPSLDFNDVAGMNYLKENIEKKIIWPITDPEGYRKFVGKGCRGIIMYGPPGCGKTLLSEAAAGEVKQKGLDINFYKVDQSDVKNMWVGKSEQRMRELFNVASKNQPAILFFDEIDSLAGTRKKETSKHGRDLSNEFKSDFDRIKDKTVLVIGATNHPWSIDSAFVRPGRFEEQLFVPPPDLEARAEILRIHTQDKKLDDEINFNKVAKLTRGYSGADLEKICKDAGVSAYERYRKNEDGRITYRDFLRGIESTKPSLNQWCTEVRDQMLDGRYPNQQVLKKGISEEFRVILDIVEEIEKNL